MTTLLQFSPSDSYVAWTVSVLLQATAVLGIAWVLASLLGCRNAAVRHATWLVALALLMLSPVTGYLTVSSGVSLVELSLPHDFFPVEPASEPPAGAVSVPELPTPPITGTADEFAYDPRFDQEVAGLPPEFPQIESTPSPTLSEIEAPAIQASSPVFPPVPSPTSPLWAPADYLRVGTLILSIVWACGIGCLLVRFLWRTRRLSLLLRQTRQVEIPELEHLLRDICHGLDLKHIPELRIWESPGPNLAPFTVGVFRPAIVLSPVIIGNLSTERLRNALVHECAHVLRHDVLVAMVQRIAVIGFWLHPLVRLMDRGLSRAREEVCDNYVLRGSDGTSYAETLVDISQRLIPSATNLAQLGLFDWPWRLEQRIADLLDVNRVRMTRVRPLRALILCALLLAALTVAGGVRVFITEAIGGPAFAGENQTPESAAVPSAGDDRAAHDKKLVSQLGLQPVQSLEDGRINAVSLQERRLTAELVEQLKGLSALNGLSLKASIASDSDLALLRELPAVETLWLSDAHVTPTGCSELRHLTKVTRLYLSGADVTDTSLELLAGVPQLKFLGLSGTSVTKTGLKNLTRFPNLTGVMFQWPGPFGRGPGQPVITDEELKILANIPTLTAISLHRGCEVTDEGVAILSKLPQLKELSISRGDITDAGLAHLKPHSGLEKLSLIEAKWFTDVGLKHLRGLTQLQELELSNGQFTDAGMAHLEPLGNLQRLTLRHAQLSQVGLAHLRPLTKLKSFYFLGMTYADAGLEVLGNMPQLEVLFLTGNQISDTGLGYLKNLTELKYLTLNNTGITDASLNCLTGMPDLRSLRISNAAVGDAGIAHLATLKRLRTLELDGTSVTDEGIKHLITLRELAHIGLNGSGITDEALVVVGSFRQLDYVTLRGTGISDAGLGHLKNLPNLRHLWISGSPSVSQPGVDDLQQALPNCEIHFDPARVEPRGGLRPRTRPDVSPRQTPLPKPPPRRPRVLSPAALQDRERNELVALGVELRSRPWQTNLTRFVLADKRLTPDIVARLGHVPSLEEAHLHKSVSTDEDLALLLHLPKIRQVRLTTLRNLTLNDTGVTTEGLESLQRALPALRVR